MPFNDDPNDPLQTPELDTSAALADISADLFGQGEEGGDAQSGSGQEPGKDSSGAETAVESSPAPKPEGEQPQAETPAESSETSAEVQAVGAPKSWTKEALAEWASISPRAQQEILKREEDFLKGITQYKAGAELGARYNAVVEPFAPILQAENVDPVQLFQSFAANHYLLSRGTPEQKLELAANLINGYGIDFNSLIAFIGDRQISPPDPRLASLEQEIATLKAGAVTRQQLETEAARQAIDAEIEAFAKDPAHPYFAEVVDDMQSLFKSGQATSLKEAYDKAIYLNPTTRQKEIDRLAAERMTSQQSAEAERQAEIARSTAANVSVLPKTRDGTIPVGSIDDTLNETLAAIRSRS